MIQRIETSDSVYLMKAKDSEEKEAWIGVIGNQIKGIKFINNLLLGKVMVGTSSSKLFVAEEED